MNPLQKTLRAERGGVGTTTSTAEVVAGSDVPMAQDHPSRTLDLAKLRGQGIAAALRDAQLFAELFKLLWGLEALRPAARADVIRAVAAGDLDRVCTVLVRPSAFRRRGTWALFWSLTAAALEIADPGRAATHEPELNGAFMALIAQAIATFPPSAGANAAVIIGDHATLGNEARTGSDFGLIIEVEHRGEVRHLVTLLQAKRATSRRTDVRRAAGSSTQLDLLVTSGVGSYLFYHAHGAPAGLGPTVRDAHAVAASNPASTDVLSAADDFAARLAIAADNMFASKVPYALPGMGSADGRDDALTMLFNPNVPGLVVNDVLIARVGSSGLEPRDVARFESDWRDLVASHRADVEAKRGNVRDRETFDEPPIAQS